MMGLPRETLVIVFLLYLYKNVRGEPGILPQLPNNKLSVSVSRHYGPGELPNSTLIFCENGPRIDVELKKSRVYTLDEKFTETDFNQYPFSSRSMAYRPITSEEPQKFTVAELKHTSGMIIKKTVTAYLIQVDPSGTPAYWLPQGDSIVIPRAPNASEPKYVFTSDFSGCAWTVTPMRNGKLRIRHVSGSNETKFNNSSEEDKGGPISYALQYKDYGYVVTLKKLIESVNAYAYMHYSAGSWKLYVQRKTCAPSAGNCKYKDGLLEAMAVNYWNQNTYKMITGTNVYRIP